ncbi:MAG: hypothetical protein Q8L77_17740 [Nitrospirota bacterium]|nr:hypothetical protein [Nitrospirota bacterium]
MKRSLASFRFPAWLSLGFTAFAGCSSGQFPTLTIYETPNAFVRLQADPTVGQNNGHSHPADISTERMAAVLRGIVIQEPLMRLPLYDDLSIPRRHRAFDEDAVLLWAPLLSLAIGKATPEEVVTFYQSRHVSGVKREVTSGGMFLDGEDLHVLLSNNRSDTHTTADTTVADTEDDRLTPLRSLTPQKGTLRFEPPEFQRSTDSFGVGKLLKWDRRELIIQVHRLPVKPVSTAP